MTNPKTSPVAESVVEALYRRLRDGDDAKDGWTDYGMEGAFFRWEVIDRELRAAIAAIPRPIEDGIPTDAGEGVCPSPNGCGYCREHGCPRADDASTDTGLVGELVEALEPFAKAADGRLSKDLLKGGVCFSQAHLIRARTALSKAKDQAHG